MDTLNLDYLLNLSDGDNEFVADVIEEFLGSVDDLMSRAKQSMEFDPGLAMPVLHALKGSSGSAGAERLSEAVRNLEVAIADARANLFPKLLLLIEDELHAAKRAMERYLAAAA